MSRRPLRKRLVDRMVTTALVTILTLLRPLPFDLGAGIFARVGGGLAARLAGWRGRIGANLSHVWPDLAPSRAKALERAVPQAVARTVFEVFRPADLRRRAADLPFEGPGAELLADRLARGGALVLTTGHIGNFNVMRHAIDARFGPLAALYRPLSNAPLNRRYVAAMTQAGGPMFPQNYSGLSSLLHLLREGRPILILHDQYMPDAPELPFLDRPAPTALSAAELALNHDAPLIPFYALRDTDRGFRLLVEVPVPATTAEEMTRALNASLERQVRAHPDQWLWTHRRWGQL